MVKRDWQNAASAPRDRIIEVRNDAEHDSRYAGYPTATFKDGAWRLSRFFVVPGGKYGRLTSLFTHWREKEPAS